MSNTEKFAAQVEKMIAKQTTGQLVEMYTLNMARMQTLTHGSDGRKDCFLVHMWIGEALDERIGVAAVEALEIAALEEVAA